jgi:predicted transposase/invertase (TIGR01784 family)
MTTNKKYKDSFFTSLFKDADTLRELYCALGGVTLPSDTPVEINTLENVLYMDFINDISFEIGGKLVVLIEHQSTINPNMALRLLLYITRILEKKISGNKLYSTKQMTIPFPEFFVLYNGNDPFPDTEIVRLSSLFAHPQDLGLSENTHPVLELEVKVININDGRNAELVNRCKKLADYSFFVDTVRSFRKEGCNLEEAIKKTIKYCEKHDILKEELEIHGSEVLNMLLEDWNLEDAKKVWCEEAREEGVEEGRKKGRFEERQIFLKLLHQGLSVAEIEQHLSSESKTKKSCLSF